MTISFVKPNIAFVAVYGKSALRIPFRLKVVRYVDVFTKVRVELSGPVSAQRDVDVSNCSINSECRKEDALDAGTPGTTANVLAYPTVVSPCTPGKLVVVKSGGQITLVKTEQGEAGETIYHKWTLVGPTAFVCNEQYDVENPSNVEAYNVLNMPSQANATITVRALDNAGSSLESKSDTLKVIAATLRLQSTPGVITLEIGRYTMQTEVGQPV